MSGLMSLLARGAQDIFLTGTDMAKKVQICHQGCVVHWPEHEENPMCICKIEEHVQAWYTLLGDQTKTTRVFSRDIFQLIREAIRDHPVGKEVYIIKGEYYS